MQQSAMETDFINKLKCTCIRHHASFHFTEKMKMMADKKIKSLWNDEESN